MFDSLMRNKTCGYLRYKRTVVFEKCFNTVRYAREYCYSCTTVKQCLSTYEVSFLCVVVDLCHVSGRKKLWKHKTTFFSNVFSLGQVTYMVHHICKH